MNEPRRSSLLPKGRGSLIMTITCANPEMYEAMAPEFFVTSLPRIRRSTRGDPLRRLSQ